MYRYIKRIFDLVVSIVALPFIIFILIIIYPLVKLDSKGPYIYKSERLGINMNKFMMYKIRTMKVNAPDIRNSDGSTFNSNSDNRVTKIGKFLRKTSIDELPQIFNVFLGSMSLIGPRPDLFSQKVIYIDEKKDISKFSVKPGITGYAQVNGRNTIDWKEKNELDKFYIDNISFLMDFKILFKTVLYVIKGKGVNRVKERENG